MSWECPYCHKPATVQSEIDSDSGQVAVSQRATRGSDWVMYQLDWVICPAKDCQKISTTLTKYIAPNKFNYSSAYSAYVAGGTKKAFHVAIEPKGGIAKPLPGYIPEQVAQDYNEACLILIDSPKASATLFRRCLQSMIRDFWGIIEKTLYLEIEKAIKQHPETADFLHPIRELGNIGAHPENDINLIVPIEEGEAELMKETIEHLIDEWYVNREKTKQRKVNLQNAVAAKKQLKVGS